MTKDAKSLKIRFSLGGLWFFPWNFGLTKTWPQMLTHLEPGFVETKWKHGRNTWGFEKKMRRMLQEIVIAWGSFIGKSRFSCHQAKWPMPALDKRWDSTGCHPVPNPWTLGYPHIHQVFCRWLPLPSTTDRYNTMFAFVDRFVFFWIHKKWYKRIPVDRRKGHPNILGWFYFLFYQQ